MEKRPAKTRFQQAETGGNGLKGPVGGLQMRSGPRGRGFESRHSDQNPQILVQEAQKSEDFSFCVAP